MDLKNQKNTKKMENKTQKVREKKNAKKVRHENYR
jgi:hypothetical protein